MNKCDFCGGKLIKLKSFYVCEECGDKVEIKEDEKVVTDVEYLQKLEKISLKIKKINNSNIKSEDIWYINDLYNRCFDFIKTDIKNLEYELNKIEEHGIKL